MKLSDDGESTFGNYYGVFTLRKSNLRTATVDDLHDADKNEVAFWYDHDSQQQWTKHMNKTFQKIAGRQTAVYYSLNTAKEAFHKCASAMAIVVEWKPRLDVVQSKICAGCATKDNVNFTCITCVDVHFCTGCIRDNGYHDAAKNFKCPKCKTVHEEEEEDDDEEEGEDDEKQRAIGAKCAVEELEDDDDEAPPTEAEEELAPTEAMDESDRPVVGDDDEGVTAEEVEAEE